ncbi:MAG: ribonuclease HII [Verrucomicrobia bacterium]|nr:MAG: ribonuclease HII [Verrucomicrobiota bacterium]
MKPKKFALLNFDKKLLTNEAGIIGIDEAGRGAFAGPVVSAAVWVSQEFYNLGKKIKEIKLINDSKALTSIQREEIFQLILEWESRGLIKFAWALSTVLEIEEHNILGASKLAMKRALQTLLQTIPHEFRVTEISELELWDRLGEETRSKQSKILVDGLPLKPFPYNHLPIIEGDGQSLAIAAASIVAKVNRDRLMIDLAKKYIGYGFEFHKGYGTEMHRDALIQKGATEIHRTKFLRNLLLNPQPETETG